MSAGQRTTDRYVLRRVPLDETRGIWGWLNRKSDPYPQGVFVPPMKPQQNEPGARRIVAAALRGEVSLNGHDYTPTEAASYDGVKMRRVRLDGGEDSVESVAQTFFAHKTRGAITVFAEGAGLEFHAFLRYYAVPLVARGYEITPLAAGTDLKGLIVRKARHTWYLADCATATGFEASRLVGWVEGAGAGSRRASDPLVSLHRALSAHQSFTMEHFRAPLGATLAGSAMSAASRHLRRDAWKWRPSPTAVAVSRAGFGYRGGYAFARRYVGPAWRVDINKAYTWALSQELPLRSSLGFCEARGRERPGVYVCEVRGPGRMPVYAGVWRDWHHGFELAYWNGERAFMVLATPEIEGMRALGYVVLPGFGLVASRTFNLAGYVDLLSAVLATHERGTLEHDLTKLYGVAVYGKLAENPVRLEVVFAAKRPDATWHPFTTPEGVEVPYLWTRRSTVFRPHQQVDTAAFITAHVRGRLYETMARVVKAGGTVVHADTDGMLVDTDPRSWGIEQGDAIGDWRISEQAERAAVIGRKGYSFGPEVRIAGVSGVTASLVEVIARGDELVVSGNRWAPPWEEGPMLYPSPRRVRATA